MNKPPKFEATWQSLCQYTVPDWYLDGKFGIFIHWGLYAVPAFGNEWYPRNMYLQGTPEYEHHLKTYGPHNRFGYKDFIPMFLAEKYDPDAWANLFKQAGARFVVPVAEHHDGFAMYDSENGTQARSDRRPGQGGTQTGYGFWRFQPPRRALVLYERWPRF
jgi:alpha-L-fucosidase